MILMIIINDSNSNDNNMINEIYNNINVIIINECNE